MTFPPLRPLLSEDFPRVLPLVDAWWGRPISAIFKRVFFEYFQNLSRVAEEDGEILGFLVGLASQSDPRVGYVQFLAVAPQARGRGLGRHLYETFFAAARKRGCTLAQALTGIDNRASVAFHRRLGFSLLPGDGTVDGLPAWMNYDGPGQHRFRFQRALDPSGVPQPRADQDE
jgi:ribosomal protein S18 acetylase RimI-like enzyme